MYLKHFFLQFMEWNIQESKLKCQISNLRILFLKNLKFIKLVTWDSIQDVHSSHKNELYILTFSQKVFFKWNFIKIKIGLNIVYF